MKTFFSILVSVILSVGITFGIITYLEQTKSELEAQIENTEITEEREELTPEPTVDPIVNIPWQTFSNQQFKFSIQYPSNVFTSTYDYNNNSNSYFRVQNYDPNLDRMGLNEGEFYMEIFTYDQERNRTAGTCQEYRTEIINPEGDAGGNRWSICNNTENGDVIINITENSETGELANRILDTVEFY